MQHTNSNRDAVTTKTTTAPQINWNGYSYGVGAICIYIPLLNNFIYSIELRALSKSIINIYYYKCFDMNWKWFQVNISGFVSHFNDFIDLHNYTNIFNKWRVLWLSKMAIYIYRPRTNASMQTRADIAVVQIKCAHVLHSNSTVHSHT